MTEASARSRRGVALVTGGARRIGRAICLRLAEAGFDVAIHHHASGDDARNLADEIASLGRRTCLLQADLRDEARVRVHAMFGLLNSSPRLPEFDPCRLRRLLAAMALAALHVPVTAPGDGTSRP